MSFQVKILLALITIVTSFAVGYKASESKLQPIITERTAQLMAIDLKAKTDQAKYKENEIEISKEINDSVNRINSYYERMLSEARNKARTYTVANSPKEADGAPAELQTAIRFEQTCALDANQVIEFQNWVRLNKFPIAE